MEEQQNKHLVTRDNSTIHTLDLRELERLKRVKLSRHKQKKFLQYYSQTFNISKSAHQLGINRRSVYDTIQNDERFKREIEELKERVIDGVEENLVVIGSQPDMRAIPAIKFILENQRKDIYGKQPETAIQVNISTEHGQISLNNLLDKPSNHPQDADFTILSSKKNKR